MVVVGSMASVAVITPEVVYRDEQGGRGNKTTAAGSGGRYGRGQGTTLCAKNFRIATFQADCLPRQIVCPDCKKQLRNNASKNLNPGNNPGY
jgi:hypothetical protein